MNMISPVALLAETEDEANIQVFLDRCQRLSMIKLLCLLTQAIQQHRGASTAVISGDTSFLSLVEKRQKSIRRMLYMLEQVSNETKDFIAPLAIENIINEWKTILIGWQQDQLMDNFQFHSHLVGSLHKLIRVSMIEQLLPGLGHQENKSLFKALFIKLPELNEYLAMLRGLCTDVAVRKACGESSQVRIAYLVKLVRKESDKVIELIEQLGETVPTVPAVDIILRQKKYLNKLLMTIEVTILESTEIHAHGSHLFDMATDIIDAYWLAIEQGIQQVDHFVYQYSTE